MNALLFPGQGVQKVGMLNDLFENNSSAKDIVNEISSSLNFDLLELLVEDPENKINLTEFAQPSILVSSILVSKFIKIDQKIEKSIFRSNLYFDGIEAWEERNWIGKTIKINDVLFKVEKNIPRCVAINLKPQSDDNSFNLLQLLKKNYNHFDMGIYLTALDDGEINIENTVDLQL